MVQNRHTGTQTAHWDIQNKDDWSLSDLSRFVLDVPVLSLRSSMADFVPCDRILQRAYFNVSNVFVEAENVWKWSWLYKTTEPQHVHVIHFGGGEGREGVGGI